MLSARDRGVPGTGWQMPETGATSSIPPIHIEETLRSVAGLNAEHRANATHHQRAVDRITSLLGRASFKGVVRDDSHLPTGRNMSTILLVIILILIFGGGGGYYAHGRYGGAGLGGVLGIVLIVLVVLWLVG